MPDIATVVRALETSLEEVEHELAVNTINNCPCENAALRRKQVNLLHELLFLYSGNPRYSAPQRLAQTAAASHSNKSWNYYDEY